ncbi:MAG: hypothetical protein AABY05_02975 [Nanoarchaeota archaeon]
MVEQIGNTAQLEQVTARLYFEFFEKNQGLFKADQQKYQASLRRYVEERIHEIKYGVRSL